MRETTRLRYCELQDKNDLFIENLGEKRDKKSWRTAIPVPLNSWRRMNSRLFTGSFLTGPYCQNPMKTNGPKYAPRPVPPPPQHLLRVITNTWTPKRFGWRLRARASDGNAVATDGFSAKNAIYQLRGQRQPADSFSTRRFMRRSGKRKRTAREAPCDHSVYKGP